MTITAAQPRRLLVAVGSLSTALLSLPLPAQSAKSWTDPSPHVRQFVSVDSGINVEVLDWGGRGRALVLLPQLGETAHRFDDWAPRLARDFHVIAITRRGFGASSWPTGGYTIARLAGDVLKVIGGLHLDRPILVGSSFAGEELSWIASNDSGHIAGLVYLDAAYDRSRTHVGDETSITRRIPPTPMQPSDMASIASLMSWMKRGTGVAVPEAEVRQIVQLDDSGRVTGQAVAPGVMQLLTANLLKPAYAAFHVPVLAIYAKRTKVEDAAPGCRDTGDETVRAACKELAAWLDKHLEEGKAELRQSPAGVEIIELRDASPFVYASHEDAVTEAILSFARRIK